MNKEDLSKYPRETVGDEVVEATGKVAGLVNSRFEMLFRSIVKKPVEKRRVEWFDSVGQRLVNLEEKFESLSPDKLAENEAFVTAFLQATQIALRNHKEEKLEALRNAIFNSVLPDSPDEALQQIFLNFIDSFTEWHLKMLVFMDDPQKWREKYEVTYPNWGMTGMGVVMEHTFPELKDQREFYDQIGKDLHSRGLIKTSNFHVTSTISGLFASGTTVMGKKFIKYITEPISN